jgi:hypothetical protein
VLQKVSLRGGYRPNAIGRATERMPQGRMHRDGCHRTDHRDARHTDPVTGGVHRAPDVRIAHGRAELTAHLMDAAPCARRAGAGDRLASAAPEGAGQQDADSSRCASRPGRSTAHRPVSPGADAQPSAEGHPGAAADAMALGPIDLTVQGVTADWLGLPRHGPRRSTGVP